jgi:gamma-glutamyltranspeptidase / glutathione hydrolase
MISISRFFLVILSSILLNSAALASNENISPETSSGLEAKESGFATTAMVVAANPFASQVGLDILNAGGSAADAAIAVQLMLNLVEPQSSGIGGGAFALWFDGEKQLLTTFDGRETAPMSATAELFLKDDGEPLKFYDAVVGGLSVGTPGTLALLKRLHENYGELAWGDLFAPTIRLARDGFPLSPRLYSLLEWDADRLSKDPMAGSLYFSDGVALPVGTLVKNPAFADTLELIAKNGSDAFYSGQLADDIITAVSNHPTNPGVLGLSDLAAYQVIERHPVCGTYRTKSICGMGPPSSGGLTVAQILGMLQHFDLSEASVQSFHLLAEASRLAFADRGLYMADADFVLVPSEGLLDPEYLKRRASLINVSKASEESAKPGVPPGPKESFQKLHSDESIELPSTSHFSIVDANGNALSMTTTIENGFGSRIMVGGFLLNNELTDFSFRAEKSGKLVANRVQPGKRPRSSMAPTIILNPDGSLHSLLGSPGGSRIIGYVTQAVIALLDWDMTPQEAASMGHIINRNWVTELEEGSSMMNHQQQLEALGHTVKAYNHTSGLHIIKVIEQGLVGGADPRREGQVLGY